MVDLLLFPNYLQIETSISPNRKFIKTDTSPDKSIFSSLYFYNMENDSIKKMGKFHQSLKYKKEMRIDLHLKWWMNKQVIFVKSGHKYNIHPFKITIKEE